MALPGLIVEIEGRVDKLEKALKRANRAQSNSAAAMERRAKQSAAKIDQTYAGMGDKIGATFRKIGPGLIAGLSIGALTAAVTQLGSVVKGIAQIGDQAKIAGLSVEKFQQLKYVGDQNRVEVDAMIDGLKELSLRADEFVTTGGGSAAESFRRLGFSASELSSKLSDPAALFAEIIDRLNDLDQAAQIRVADEIFGGTGGEKFVQLLGQGKGAIRATMNAAKAAGAVLDADLIKKAEELDRRFAALTTRTSTFFKTLTVEMADAAVKIATLRTDTDDLFRSREQANGLLGPGVVAELDATADAAGENAVAIGALRGQYESLGDQSVALAPQLEAASLTLRSFGEADAATELASVAQEMRDLAGEMADGSVEAENFETHLQALIDRAGQAFAGLNDIDRATFSNVIGGIGAIGSALGRAIELARSLRATLPGAAPNGVAAPVTVATQSPSFWDSADGMELANSRTTPAITSIKRPQTRPNDIDWAMPPEPKDTSASGGGGGGASKSGGGGSSAARKPRQTDLEREIASITEETAALRVEAAELARVTGAKTDLARATDLARTRADLLNAATRSGVEITPALSAKIDELAGAYAAAGVEADAAADNIAEIQENSKAGARAITDTFMAMASGAMTAKEAMAQLILEMIKATIQKRILAAVESAGPGSVIGTIGKVLAGGFSEGGYTGNGEKFEPAGVVHKGEFVISKEATSRIGVPALENLHASAKRGYSGGGLVGGTAGGKSLALPHARVAAAPAVTVNAPITVNGGGGTPAQNKNLADQLARELDATIRKSVAKEILNQRRPGNLLADR